jgi:hypothetical protein
LSEPDDIWTAAARGIDERLFGGSYQRIRQRPASEINAERA